jgi:hypothetical protein
VPIHRAVVQAGTIQQRILLIRGVRVIIDAYLTHLFGAPMRRLNEQVRRNRRRFPADFMSRLTAPEKTEVVANCDHLSNLRFSMALPRAFTERGAIVTASVLHSPRAVRVSIFVVRPFVAIRQAIAADTQLAKKVA